MGALAMDGSRRGCGAAHAAPAGQQRQQAQVPAARCIRDLGVACASSGVRSPSPWALAVGAGLALQPQVVANQKQLQVATGNWSASPAATKLRLKVR